MLRTTLAALLVALMSLQYSLAFLPPVPSRASSTTLQRSPLPSTTTTITSSRQAPLSRPQARGSLSRMYGIFGLGTAELVVIAVVAGFVLGPDKLVDLARGVGRAAGELKAVPAEFEKGMKTGEEQAVKSKSAIPPPADKKQEVKG